MSNETVDLKRMLQRRGNLADMPLLEDGEFGLTLDEKGLYIGAGTNMRVLTESSIEDSLTSTKSDKVLSAKQGAVLRGQVENMKNIYDGHMQNFNNDILNKQDKIIHESDSNPLNVKLIWYDTTI